MNLAQSVSDRSIGEVLREFRARHFESIDAVSIRLSVPYPDAPTEYHAFVFDFVLDGLDLAPFTPAEVRENLTATKRWLEGMALEFAWLKKRLWTPSGPERSLP